MAKTKAYASLEFSFNTNIRQHIDWMIYLTHGHFERRYGELFRTQGNITERLTHESRLIVKHFVYDAYTPKTPAPDYERSLNLLNSMRAISFVGSDLANINIISDVTIAGRETDWSRTGTVRANEMAGLYSYAAFFIEPHTFSSFIKPSGAPFRDFYTPLIKQVTKVMRDQQIQAITMALRESKPQ